MDTNKIIIDTDPGVDDALAIMWAASSPALEILGICTVYGNSCIENTTVNALTLCQIMGKNIPVFQGMAKPIYGDSKPANSHGLNGFGGFKIDNLIKNKQKQTAIEFYLEILDKSESKSISVIVIGPGTNLAVLKSSRPDLFQKIKEIVAVAGVFLEPGNITKYCEFNSYCDPYSLKELLTSDVETVLIPANVCRKVQFSMADLLKLNNNQRFLSQIADIYVSYYQNDAKYGGFEGGVMYDLLAVAYILKPEIFQFRAGQVLVSTTNNKYYGQTTFSKNPKQTLKTATNIDAKALKELFFQTLKL